MAHFTSNTYTLKREILTFSNKISNKGKIKMPLYYKGKKHDAYLSHVKVQITASRKDICLVLVYGITEHAQLHSKNGRLVLLIGIFIFQCSLRKLKLFLTVCVLHWTE